MLYQLILWASSVAIFFGYLSYAYSKFGITRSISKTYYTLQKKNKQLFQAATISYGITLGLAGGHLLTYIAGALVALVGFAPDSKDSETEEKVHIVGATGGIVAAMIAMIHFGYWYLPIIQAAFTAPAMKWSWKNHTYWIEVLAFVLTAGGILAKILY